MCVLTECNIIIWDFNVFFVCRENSILFVGNFFNQCFKNFSKTHFFKGHHETAKAICNQSLFEDQKSAESRDLE